MVHNLNQLLPQEMQQEPKVQETVQLLHLLPQVFHRECPEQFHTQTLLCTMDNLNTTWVNTKEALATTMQHMVNLVVSPKVGLDINK